VSTTPDPDSLPPATAAKIDRGVANFLKLKNAFGLYSGVEILRHIDSLPSGQHIVEGLIAPSSVNILVGDSGIGKSPLAYQMALAAASGTLFLGMAVKQSKVIYLDYENHMPEVRSILIHLCRHLGLRTIPEWLALWPLAAGPDQLTVEEVTSQFAPGLVIIDSLRTFSPDMETDSRKAVEQIKRLREISSEHGTAFLLVHHLRKNGGTGAGENAGLEPGNALDWLRRAAGVRALINQTDSRLAFACRKGADEAVLSGHFRTRGEVGPFLIRRERDVHGDPAGYARFEPVPALIENADQEAAFARLAHEFTFGDAERLLGRQSSATTWFVQKLIRLGLAHKVGHGKYHKHVPDQQLAA
jgi:hypothetical protein